MDPKGKERGILKLDPRPRVVIEPCKSELTPQGSCEHGPSSPQPSVDRLSVTWAEPGSMTSSGVNLFHLPSETTVSTEVKFSPSAGDGSDDEDYSASLSAVLRQRRASVRRSRKGRAGRPSSPFLQNEARPRRRSSVFTTSSGDTAISMEETPAVVTQDQIFENIQLNKLVLGSVKLEHLGIRRKLKIVHQARGYIKRHEGQLQERLAQSKSTRDIYARFNIFIAAKWQQLKREAANTSNLLRPWELRIKEIESHFGSVVASYFTFLRWLFWVNLVVGFILLVFVIVPEYLTADPQQDGERKVIMEEERRNATNLLTLWEFEGMLKCSPIFYGYYSNIERPQYRMPLAYFLTGLAVYVYSFVAILRKMAENSRMSKLSEKEDECIFSWKLFTGWDFMIGNAETAHNRIASVILGFKEALLEEAEKKKDFRNWRILSLRAIVNVCVVLLLFISAYAVVFVVSRSDDDSKSGSWLRENETTIVVTGISIVFPVFFELLGLLEHYHPRKQLRLQLARIMLLNLLNLYSLIFALFSKIDGMSLALNQLKPNATNATATPINPWIYEPSNGTCIEEMISCEPCSIPIILSAIGIATELTYKSKTTKRPEELNMYSDISTDFPVNMNINDLVAENLEKYGSDVETTTISDFLREKQRIADLLKNNYLDYFDVFNNESDFKTSSDVTTTNLYNYNDYTKSEITDATTETEETDKTTSNYSSDINTYTKNTSIDFNSELTTEEVEEMTMNEYTTFASTDFTNDYSTENTENVNSHITNIPSGYSNENSLDVSDYTDLISTDLTSKYSTETMKTPASTESSDVKNDQPMSRLPKITTYSYTNFPYTTYKMLNTTKDSKSESSMEPNSNEIIAVSKKYCPDLSLNCTTICRGRNITQVFSICSVNGSVIYRTCYVRKCVNPHFTENTNGTNITDIVYEDEKHNKQYNLTVPTRKKLLKLCWETMFGQELIKLTMMDLVFMLLGTLFMDFFRALFVRYMNRCWCWDLEKKFPEYGDFKIAENILHLINNQGMVWMGMFFSPGLVVLNVVKLMIMMYLRSWAVMTCNVPHEVVFRVSKSNNFYLALLLTMLFLCVLPVGYTIVWVKPSWHCGPFSEYDRIYYIMTSYIYKLLPKSLNFALEYMASPAIVIPLLVLLILIIYYLTSLTNSLREANNDLKFQLRRERTEERRKMFQLADTRTHAGSSAMDNTPLARWKKALGGDGLPLSKSIDSDDRKTSTADETVVPAKTTKKRGGIFAKIVNMALDKKSDVSATSEAPSPSSYRIDDETDTDFHETLPEEILKAKNIKISKIFEHKKKNIVEFKTDKLEEPQRKDDLKVKVEAENESSDKKAVIQKQLKEKFANIVSKSRTSNQEELEKVTHKDKMINEKQTSESSTQSRQSDSIGSVIPVIMISTTESDEEALQPEQKRDTKTKERKHKEYVKQSRGNDESEKRKKTSSDSKSLRRQSSVDSLKEQKHPKEAKPEEGHKYQYSL